MKSILAVLVLLTFVINECQAFRKRSRPDLLFHHKRDSTKRSLEPLNEKRQLAASSNANNDAQETVDDLFNDIMADLDDPTNDLDEAELLDFLDQLDEDDNGEGNGKKNDVSNEKEDDWLMDWWFQGIDNTGGDLVDPWAENEETGGTGAATDEELDALWDDLDEMLEDVEDTDADGGSASGDEGDDDDEVDDAEDDILFDDEKEVEEEKIVPVQNKRSNKSSKRHLMPM